MTIDNRCSRFTCDSINPLALGHSPPAVAAVRSRVRAPITIEDTFKARGRILCPGLRLLCLPFSPVRHITCHVESQNARLFTFSIPAESERPLLIKSLTPMCRSRKTLEARGCGSSHLSSNTSSLSLIALRLSYGALVFSYPRGSDEANLDEIRIELTAMLRRSRSSSCDGIRCPVRLHEHSWLAQAGQLAALARSIFPSGVSSRVPPFALSASSQTARARRPFAFIPFSLGWCKSAGR